MTVPLAAVEAIYQRFIASGIVANVVLDNEDIKFESAWARLVVRHSARAQDTIGRKTNRRFRSSASVLVQVYTPINTGVNNAHDLAKQVVDLFEGESFSGLDFTAAQTRESGSDGKWYQVVVEAPFDYDETK